MLGLFFALTMDFSEQGAPDSDEYQPWTIVSDRTDGICDLPPCASQGIARC